MTLTGFYGRNVRQFLHLEYEPPSLITRSLRNAEIAVTETRNDTPARSLSGGMPLEDSYVVSLKLNDYPSCELWERGKCVIKANIRAGATYLYDMKDDPRFVIDKPFHSLHFYVPRSALDAVTEQLRAPRIGELACQLGIGHNDEVVRHIGASLLQSLRRPEEANQLFIDYTMLAVTVHVAQTYGGLPRNAERARQGLSPWQMRRACEKLNSDLSGKLPLAQIAADFGLSVSHFSRSFRLSTGLPPHQWLLRQRISVAKQLMTVRSLSLAEIAISAGVANQSHFTRVFSTLVGVSPAVFRRETHGALESEPRPGR